MLTPSGDAETKLPIGDEILTVLVRSTAKDAPANDPPPDLICHTTPQSSIYDIRRATAAAGPQPQRRAP